MSTSQRATDVGQLLLQFPDSDSQTGGKPIADTDKAEFWQRVATYTVSVWARKPVVLSPLVCSRFGWSCVDVDALRCCGCAVTILVQLPNVQSSKHQMDKSVAAFEARLVSGHHKFCHWGSCPLPETIYLIDVDDGSFVSDLKDRVDSLSALSLDELNITFDQDGWDEELTRANLRLEHVDAKVLRLALAGWRSGSEVRILRCDRCLRKLGLWSTEKASDPLRQHWDWCPWVSGRTGPARKTAVRIPRGGPSGPSCKILTTDETFRVCGEIFSSFDGPREPLHLSAESP